MQVLVDGSEGVAAVSLMPLLVETVVFLGAVGWKSAVGTGELVALEERGGGTHGEGAYGHGLLADAQERGGEEGMEEVILCQAEMFGILIEGMMMCPWRRLLVLVLVPLLLLLLLLIAVRDVGSPEETECASGREGSM
jgi:hypothetical protein